MRITAQTPDYTTLVAADLVVQIWHDETTLAGVTALAETLEQSGCQLMLVITCAGARAPTAEARRFLSELMVRRRDQMRACALAYEGRGFAAATIRGIVAGLTLAAGHPFPYKVFAEVGAALAWFQANGYLSATAAANAAQQITALRAGVEVRE